MPRMESKTIDTPRRNRGAFVAVSLACVLLLSVVLVGSRPAAALTGTLEVVYSGLDWPTAFAFAPDGRLFVAERYSGKILIIENGTVLPDAFYQFDDLGTLHDEGLLGLALDPSFPSAPWVYVYYTFDDADNGTVYNRIVRIQATGNTGGPMEVLLDQIPSGVWHIGGPIQFGPDGKLYAVVGDSYIPANAQNLSTMAGKVLRMNPDGSVPDDNPFVGNASVNPFIYTYGHRNNFGIAFQPATGDAIVTENGPECNDEVNRLVPGRNYGWGPTYTCTHPPPDPLNTNRDGPDPVLPMIWYSPNTALTNAIVYDGSSFAGWQGDFFFGTWNTRSVHRLDLAPPLYDTVLSDEVIVTLPVGASGGIVDVEEGLDGAIWLSDPDTIYRFYDTSLPPVASFTVSSSAVLPGAPVTFDATGSYDPDGSIVSYAWDFGDGGIDSGAVVTHAYETYGPYNVTLVVTDFDGLTGVETVAVRVLARPTVAFVSELSIPIMGAWVPFNASGSTDPDGTITSYEWDWGDGSSEVVGTFLAEHTFAMFGTYTVTLTVTDSDGLTSESTASIDVFAAPTASFAFSPTSPDEAVGVHFEGSGSSDPDGTIVAYDWDFGDGTNGTGSSPIHPYASAGTFLVTLQVTDDMGLTNTTRESLVVRPPNVFPTAVLAIAPTRAVPGEFVAFNASGSTDSDGVIVLYYWEFGDGGSGDGSQVTHAYATAGTYPVLLTVVDDRGGSDTSSGEVHVNRGPVAAFVTSPDSGYPGVPIEFNASASSDADGTIVSYVWDFGDGTAETGMVSVHTYEDQGSYTVVLLVTDDLGAESTWTKTIDVGNRAPEIGVTSPQDALVLDASESATLDVGASDPDGDPLTYTWTVNGQPVAGSSHVYEFSGRGAGTYVVRVVVSDGIASVEHEWVIEVQARVGPSDSGWPLASLVLVAALVATLVALILATLWSRRRRSP